MYSKEEFSEKIKKISEVANDNEDVMNELKELSDNTTEVFDRLGQKEVETDEDGVSFKEKYEDLKRQYRDRFFTNPKEVKENQDNDTENDGEMDYDSLFSKRESDYR